MTSEQLKVEQVDREAAADYVRDNQQPRLERNVRAGKAYAGLAESFAKHRLAERERIAAWLREETLNEPRWRYVTAYYADMIERGDHEQGGA